MQKKKESDISLKLQLLICWHSVFANYREAGQCSLVNPGSITPSSYLQGSIYDNGYSMGLSSAQQLKFTWFSFKVLESFS